MTKDMGSCKNYSYNISLHTMYQSAISLHQDIDNIINVMKLALSKLLNSSSWSPWRMSSSSRQLQCVSEQ